MFGWFLSALVNTYGHHKSGDGEQMSKMNVGIYMMKRLFLQQFWRTHPRPFYDDITGLGDSVPLRCHG